MTLWDLSIEDLPFNICMPLGFLVIAFVIFWRRSDHTMGLLTSLMLVFLGPYLASGANNLIAVQPGWHVPNAVLVTIGSATFFLFLFLFPNGRFVPLWIQWLVLAAAVVVLTGNLISPFSGPVVFAFLTSILAGIASQIYRYARVSTPTERQQTKWVLAGLSGIVFVLLFWFLILEPGRLAFPESPAAYFLFQSLWTALALLLPLSIAISILRYRLWDIDLLIRRTLVYGALTVTLAFLYLGAVVVLQQIFRALTGQGLGLAGLQGSPIVIVISTLVIAALFNPLHRRIQQDIDRRFYRSKYDAQQALAAFAATARDETDLDALASELLHVVEDTMQPASKSFWLVTDGKGYHT